MVSAGLMKENRLPCWSCCPLSTMPMTSPVRLSATPAPLHPGLASSPGLTGLSCTCPSRPQPPTTVERNQMPPLWA